MLVPLLARSCGLVVTMRQVAGKEGASIDPRLVAIAVALAQCPPGLQLLKAHLLAVKQVVHAAAEDLVPAWSQEVHPQGLPPRRRRERVRPRARTGHDLLIRRYPRACSGWFRSVRDVRHRLSDATGGSALDRPALEGYLIASG